MVRMDPHRVAKLLFYSSGLIVFGYAVVHEVRLELQRRRQIT